MMFGLSLAKLVCFKVLHMQLRIHGGTLCEPNMVPIVALNPYFLSNSGFQFSQSIEKHKKSISLGFVLNIELRLKFGVLLV